LTHRALGGSRNSASVRPIIFCDFDGTITLADVTDEILRRLAAPGWVEIERMWADGIIGSKECLERQLALVVTTPAALNALIDSIPVDPYFAGFLRFVDANAVPFFVVSDGLDYVIRRVLRRCRISEKLRNGTHFFSSAVRVRSSGISISFPHALDSCTHGCATCKPLVIRKLREQHWPVLYIGDGLSDRHAVTEADFVFARRPLLEYCRDKDIPSCLFEDFSEVESSLETWLSGGAPLEMDAVARRSHTGF
jgi:2-hydroxy-3-keto-5-methylthiopentenyl-1-phosphate phosphatase